MPEETRQWLLAHLDAQVAHLAALTEVARRHPGEPERLVAIRDEVFTIRETLDTLGVDHARASNADWNRVIGSTLSEPDQSATLPPPKPLAEPLDDPQR